MRGVATCFGSGLAWELVFVGIVVDWGRALSCCERPAHRRVHEIADIAA